MRAFFFFFLVGKGGNFKSSGLTRTNERNRKRKKERIDTRGLSSTGATL